MRFSIHELLLSPLICVASVPIVTTATFIGMSLLPQFIDNGSEIRDWFIGRGLPVNFVCGHLTFYVMEIPTILVLACLTTTLFMFRTRFLDLVSIVVLGALPFVTAIGVGWYFLTRQSLTALTMIGIIAAYIIARRRFPNPELTRSRLGWSLTFALSLLGACVATWDWLT